MMCQTWQCSLFFSIIFSLAPCTQPPVLLCVRVNISFSLRWPVSTLMLAKWQHQSLVSCQRWSVGSRLVHVKMKATSPYALSLRTVRLTRARRRGTATRYPVILSNQPAPCGSNQCHVWPPQQLCQFVTCARPLVLLCAKRLAQNQTYLANLSGHWTSRPLALNGHFDVALWLGWQRWVFGAAYGALFTAT